MSYISESIRQALDPVEVCHKYGLELNRQNRARCPFHGGRDFNFQVYQGRGHGFHCFVCGKHGDSIALAKQLLGLEYADAINVLDKDFALGIIGQEIERVKVNAVQRELALDKIKIKKNKQNLNSMLDQHRKYHQKLKERPKSWEEMDDGFIEALQKMDDLNYKIDVILDRMVEK